MVIAIITDSFQAATQAVSAQVEATGAVRVEATGAVLCGESEWRPQVLCGASEWRPQERCYALRW